MLKGLRTIVYHVCNLEIAKMWYSELFEIEPYFDESFYVGFNIDGFELGLDPSDKEYTKGNGSITYWKVEDIDLAFERFRSKKVSIHQDIHSVGEGIRLGSINDPFGNVIGLIEISD
jgi:predicted enzyme related to lactoylglutathione lyase